MNDLNEISLRAGDPSSERTVLVTGATGYIGGRLVPRLLEAGYRVRCLGRSLAKLRARPFAADPRVELREIDLEDRRAAASAMGGCCAAFYLVHSMATAGRAYRRRDLKLAAGFARAAAGAGVARIVYLGGLGETGKDLSEHLASRREVERALASGPVPVTVFRAAMIIGSGSASFEILRYLVERLPVMVTPRWVRTEAQPIAVSNVLHYLVACLARPETEGVTLDIGGPDVLSYRALMDEMAQALGLPRRVVLPVPVLTPRLSAAWIHLVTPIGHALARPLAEGLRNRVVCRDDRAARWMPQRLLGVREAIRAAVGETRSAAVETSWADAGVMPGDPDWAGGRVFLDERETEVGASTQEVFRAVTSLGGRRGYHGAGFLWDLRGALDRVLGGPGLRRGRRDPERLRYGDALDFWRVTAYEPGRRLELRAEMRLPGAATLEFVVFPAGPARTRLVQRARFRPRGLAGLAYWYAVSPLHRFVFGSMLRGIAREAEASRRRSSPAAPGLERRDTCGAGTLRYLRHFTAHFEAVEQHRDRARSYPSVRRRHE